MSTRVVTTEEAKRLLGGKKRHKFGAVKTLYNGVMYDSAGEAGYAAELDLKKKAGVIQDYVRQVRTPLVVNGVKVCELRWDFRVWLKDGTVKVVDFKGMILPIFRLKLKLFRALYPKEIVEIVTKNGVKKV